MLSVREVTKKNQNRKAITGVNWKKNEKQMQTGHIVKSRNGQQDEQWLAGCTVLAGKAFL